MSSFLKEFENVGMDILRGAGTVVSFVGGPAAGAAATAVGGPVAGAVVQALFNSIVQAEKNHLAGQGASGSTPAGITQTFSMDPRKAAVIQDFMAFLPVIEALAAATGHPIADPAGFEAALPIAVDATVQGFNAYAEMIAALHATPIPKAA